MDSLRLYFDYRSVTSVAFSLSKLWLHFDYSAAADALSTARLSLSHHLCFWVRCVAVVIERSRNHRSGSWLRLRTSAHISSLRSATGVALCEVAFRLGVAVVIERKVVKRNGAEITCMAAWMW